MGFVHPVNHYYRSFTQDYWYKKYKAKERQHFSLDNGETEDSINKEV